MSSWPSLTVAVPAVVDGCHVGRRPRFSLEARPIITNGMELSVVMELSIVVEERCRPAGGTVTVTDGWPGHAFPVGMPGHFGGPHHVSGRRRRMP
ncbi:hypothetical protein [Actinoplanes sp. NBRC 101535]|uniref:hypothetical protein n=1 Tax=Actinoplanes sp. NBRC 101535 TaxID=3032196 RepID=UPI0025524603|nr:hypothetical protein [Actinoplanes sp. NBRC 101535]